MKYLRKFDSVSDMNTVIANSTIGILGLAYNGSTPVMKIKSGGSPTPPTPVVDPTVPFYIEDVSGSANTVQIKKLADSSPTLTIEKSTDSETWESMGSTSTTAITASIPANGKLYLRCSTNGWCDDRSNYNTINTTGNCNVGGNIMSLVYGSSFTGNETIFPTVSGATFHSLFYQNTMLVNAADLLLPATTLVSYCYINMFQGCSSLTTAPALPATTLTVGCYQNMFQGCSSLTTAPALPATTLAYYCYSYMFRGCSSLTTAPALPATTLVESCYDTMFRGCTNLNYIECLATYIPNGSCNTWVRDVAASGTFVKNPNMSSWTTGNSGIPEGWTVQDASE